MADLLLQTTKLLQQQILIDKQPYTYKLLSRELNIHVHDAKKLLYSFYLKNKDLVSANFVIFGKLKDQTGSTIKLTEDLEDRNLFEELKSISVYSLAPKNCRVNEVVKSVNIKIRDMEVTEEKLTAWGVFQGPTLVKSIEQTTPSVRSKSLNNLSMKNESTKTAKSELPTKISAVKRETKKNKEPDMSSIAEKMRAKFKKPTDTEDTTPNSKQPTFGKPTTEFSTISATTKHSSATSRKENASSKASDAVEVIDDDEKEIPVKRYAANAKAAEEKKKAEESIANTRNKKKTTKEIQLESLFDSDDDYVMDEDKPHSQEEEDSRLTKDELDELNELDELVEPVKNSGETPANEEEEDEEAGEENNNVEAQDIENENISKNDTVKQYYDEDGFLVTEKKTSLVPKAKTKPKAKAKTKTTTATESKEKETETNKRVTPAPSAIPASKKTKVGSTGKQSSLLSFFGKKTR